MVWYVHKACGAFGIDLNRWLATDPKHVMMIWFPLIVNDTTSAIPFCIDLHDGSRRQPISVAVDS